MASSSRRRWLPWTIAAIVLLALGVALTQIPPAPPYGFLRGHQGIEVVNDLSAPPEPITELAYSYRADFDEVAKAATPDIEADGLTLFLRSDNEVVFCRPGHKGAKRILIPPVVYIYRDSVYEGGAGWRGRRSWVTVVVPHVERPSWFDNLKSWLGL